MSEMRRAATVILLRDGSDGLETLLLRRNSKIAFGGMWVFPGGRVEDADRTGLAPDDELEAARRAAVREAQEETGQELDGAALVPFSHWTPPSIAPKRYLTWFFVAAATSADVTIDQGEIHDHAWLRPADAMAQRNALEIELAPPTWVTLATLAPHGDTAAALAALGACEPEYFETRVGKTEDGLVTLWAGDAGYESSDATLPGARHRLLMYESGWRYERT